MAKVQLFRQSKNPVNLEDYKAYQEDWVKYFDSVQAKYSLDMEKTHKMLEYGEKKLIKKYNKTVLIELPKTNKKIKELCQQFGAPIMFAERQDGAGIVAIIMDEL
jgi:hypothetical protein